MLTQVESTLMLFHLGMAYPFSPIYVPFVWFSISPTKNQTLNKYNLKLLFNLYTPEN